MGEIHNATRIVLSEIARCHMASFPDALASALGSKYVKKMLEWYISSDKTFLFYVEECGICVGYCGGMVKDGSFETGSASSMAQYSFKQGIYSLSIRPWVIFHKEFVRKNRFVLKNLKMKIRKFIFPNKPLQKSSPYFQTALTGLVTIGVHPDFQGKGYGSLLLREFENKTKEMGIKQMQLSVSSDNVKAIKSYGRNGWIKAQSVGNSLSMVKTIR